MFCTLFLMNSIIFAIFDLAKFLLTTSVEEAQRCKINFVVVKDKEQKTLSAGENILDQICCSSDRDVNGIP